MSYKPSSWPRLVVAAALLPFAVLAAVLVIFILGSTGAFL